MHAGARACGERELQLLLGGGESGEEGVGGGEEGGATRWDRSALLLG